jgi:hypothetical protein
MRSTSSKAAYPGSALAKRNASLRAAAQLSALRDTHALAGQINSDRVTTLESLCRLDALSGAQIDAGREPHLLRENQCEPGELGVVAIHDTGVAGVGKDGRADVELLTGTARLPRNTLVYWK